MEYPEELVVEVTSSDIENGIKGDGQYCPVARAFNRLGYNYVEVDIDGVLVGEREYMARGLADFISAFDEGFYVDPRLFDFRLVEGE